MDRWRQYNAPYNPIPNQASLNSLPSAITNHDLITEINFRPHLSSQKKLVAIQRLTAPHCHKVKELAQDILEKLPTFWATQEEVKVKLFDLL